MKLNLILIAMAATVAAPVAAYADIDNADGSKVYVESTPDEDASVDASDGVVVDAPVANTEAGKDWLKMRKGVRVSGSHTVAPKRGEGATGDQHKGGVEVALFARGKMQNLTMNVAVEDGSIIRFRGYVDKLGKTFLCEDKNGGAACFRLDMSADALWEIADKGYMFRASGNGALYYRNKSDNNEYGFGVGPVIGTAYQNVHNSDGSADGVFGYGGEATVYLENENFNFLGSAGITKNLVNNRIEGVGYGQLQAALKLNDRLRLVLNTRGSLVKIKSERDAEGNYVPHGGSSNDHRGHLQTTLGAEYIW